MQSAGLLREAKPIAIAKEADIMGNIIIYKRGVTADVRSQDVCRLLPMASLLGALIGVAQDIETLLLPLKLRGSEGNGGDMVLPENGGMSGEKGLP